MATADKVVDYVSALLSSLIPKPADVVLKPLIKPVGDNLKAWLGEKETQKALLEAASKAENDFRELAKEKFGNDKLTQAVASFPLHNGELFQAALQSLPSHFNETILENHLSNDLSKYWTDEFTPDEIRAGTALYLECLRLRLLRVNGFADIVTRLAILRTDRRTEDILDIVREILERLSTLSTKGDSGGILRIHQLPPAPADFTGRELLITQLLNDFNSHKGATISGLTGMGGIGKTALGLAVAHQIVDQYPDAQIFLDLKGTTTPLSVVDIARYVILQFEPNADLRGLDETNFSGVYQSVLHGRRALIFLDNASDANQITPLIPPAPCALLVTSRKIFSVAGIKTHKVGVLEENEAKDFLLELCPRINDKAAELAKACAYLPLALRIAGSFLKINMNWKVDKYLEELKSTRGRFEILAKSRAGAELTTEPDVLATFELSYNQLKDEEKKNWRALGVFPAPFDSGAAAAVWGMGEDDTDNLLANFMRYSLVEYNETSSRYELHDLLAEYARTQMESGEEQEVRFNHAAHYKDVLSAANNLYMEGGENIMSGLRLFDNEYRHISYARLWVSKSSNGKDELKLCNEFPNSGYMILSLRLHPREYIDWLETGLAAAVKLNNKKYQGYHLGNLGLAYADLGETHKAIEFYEQALVISLEIGDRRHGGSWLGDLGLAYADLGETRKAIEFYEQALVISREIGDRRHEGNWLGNLGIAYENLGETRKAIEFYEQALIIAREIGARRGEGNTLGNLGTVYANLGETRKAIEFYEQRIVIAREIGDRRGEGSALGNLGLVYADLGETRKAIEFYEQRMIIAHEIDDRRGEGIASFNMGLSFYGLDEKERAIDLVKQALKIFEAIESPNAEKVRTKLKEWGALE